VIWGCGGVVAGTDVGVVAMEAVGDCAADASVADEADGEADGAVAGVIRSEQVAIAARGARVDRDALTAIRHVAGHAYSAHHRLRGAAPAGTVVERIAVQAGLAVVEEAAADTVLHAALKVDGMISGAGPEYHARIFTHVNCGEACSELGKNFCLDVMVSRRIVFIESQYASRKLLTDELSIFCHRKSEVKIVADLLPQSGSGARDGVVAELFDYPVIHNNHKHVVSIAALRKADFVHIGTRSHWRS
jgi:hypothetical protein